jgi:hypothetical protein
MSDTQENARGDKRVPMEQMEQRGVVQDVVVPIAQAATGGLGVGAANAYVNHKLSQQKNPPPEKKAG